MLARVCSCGGQCELRLMLFCVLVGVEFVEAIDEVMVTLEVFESVK